MVERKVAAPKALIEMHEAKTKAKAAATELLGATINGEIMMRNSGYQHVGDFESGKEDAMDANDTPDDGSQYPVDFGFGNGGMSLTGM